MNNKDYKYSNIAKMSDSDLNDNLVKFKSMLLKLRFQKVVGESKNAKMTGLIRKFIARINTERNNRIIRSKNVDKEAIK